MHVTSKFRYPFAGRLIANSRRPPLDVFDTGWGEDACASRHLFLSFKGSRTAERCAAYCDFGAA
ncbi:hypothetical protein C0Z16_32995 [Paraburkholderia rhynchosiae]|uniref:Uncharacterized protein n=1 Tax=Paraburkholderia rhynchosiae TaxID=487049 RepID=A0ABX4UUW2_9BURK|nr:hypothetical protein C0Z16_32995 [Paraburkholderia rhynchosiae]